MIGKRYKEVIDILETNNVIAVNKGYSSGSFSKGYTLIGKHLSSRHKEVLIQDNKFRARLLVELEENIKKNDFELSKIPYITQWYNDKLTIDLNTAHSFIEFYKKDLTDVVTKAGRNKNAVFQRYNSSIVSATKVSKGDFNLSRTGKDNRLHSSVVSMKKELKSFLLYDGQPLVGIDIKSSQPYLLNLLLKESLYNEEENEINIKTIYPELYSILTPDNIKNIKRILMSVSYNDDFGKIDWSKDFYSQLVEAEKHRFKNDKKFFINRAQVKKTIMIALYNKKHKSDAFRRFEIFYPKIGRIIRVFNSLGHKKDAYLPILMQRLESKLMLEIVAKRISVELPDAPMISVHDSFLTTAPYQEPISKIVEEELSRLVGTKAGLNLENISPEDIFKNFDKIIEEDLDEIYKNKAKYSYEVGERAHLLDKFPEKNGKRILSTRYLSKEDEI